MMELEICVDSVESAVAAEIGGAQRVELCSALAEGGLTPSAGLIRGVRSRIDIGVYVMIRPRGGDFFYSDEELLVMQDDIAYAAQSGANGVVFGLLTAEGDIDVKRTRKLVEMARPMEVTFHRAIDMSRDMLSNPVAPLEDIVRTGADRILTSGGAQSAALGMGHIQTLVQAAGDRVQIMACGGVRAKNVQKLARATGVHEFHAALRRAVPSPVVHQNHALHLSGSENDEYARHVVLAEDVRGMRQALEALIDRDAETLA